MLGNKIMETGKHIEKFGQKVLILEVVATVSALIAKDYVVQKAKDGYKATKDVVISAKNYVVEKAIAAKEFVVKKVNQAKAKLKAWKTFRSTKKNMKEATKARLQEIISAKTIDDLERLANINSYVNNESKNELVNQLLERVAKLESDIYVLQDTKQSNHKVENSVFGILANLKRDIVSLNSKVSDVKAEDIQESIDKIINNEVLKPVASDKEILISNVAHLIKSKAVINKISNSFLLIEAKEEYTVALKTIGKVVCEYVEKEVIVEKFVCEHIETEVIKETIDTEALEEINCELEKANTSLESEAVELAKENKVLENKINELENGNVDEDVKAENVELADTIEELSFTNESLYTEINNLKKEFSTYKKSARQTIKAQKDKVITKNRELSDKIDGLLINQETLKANISALRSNHKNELALYENKVALLVEELNKEKSINKDFASNIIENVKESKVVKTAQTLFNKNN